MRFGIPTETGFAKGMVERRVALSPAGVRELCQSGAEVVLQQGAGQGAGFADEEYRAAGVRIVYSAAEAYGRADVVLRVERPRDEEWELFPEGSTLIAFLHLHVASPRVMQTLRTRNLTVLGLEAIREDTGSFPLQKIASQIAGRMAPQIAGRLLEASSGGLGVLLAGLPGIPPADVVILGAGVLGSEATRAFLGAGASVPDGATLQMGIGTIPDAVLASLTGKRDLGVHTEMISDGLMQAMEAGIFTGARKTLHPGRALATLILGSRALYRFVDNNPAFELHPSTYTNDPFVIAQNDNLIAINSALEIDLTGQVCADSIGTAIYSGFGGQLDFIRGAARSRGGKPIIALPATARGGDMSRIVPLLKPGAGVVTTRGDVHYVVTEFGVAQLYGKTLRQRAQALIGITHPQFRDTLERAAKERKLL